MDGGGVRPGAVRLMRKLLQNSRQKFDIVHENRKTKLGGLQFWLKQLCKW